MNNVPCLINQSYCGRVTGNSVCPKCGMDERVVYPGQADREAAQAAALKRFWAVEKDSHRLSVETPGEPVSPQQASEVVLRSSGLSGRHRLLIAALFVALISFGGGAWWWQHQQNAKMAEAQAQVAAAEASADRARAEQAKRLKEERQRADAAAAARLVEAERVAKLEREKQAAEKVAAEAARAAAQKKSATRVATTDTKAQPETVPGRVNLQGVFNGFSCGVSSYGGASAQALRDVVSRELYSIYGCSVPPEATSKDGYVGDFHTPHQSDTPWPGFANKSVVFYYADANKQKATAVARDLSRRLGHSFAATRGAGQGIRPEWYEKAIVVHIKML